MPACAPIPRRGLLSRLVALVIVTGCSGAEPRLYVLTPMAPNNDASRNSRRSIGIQPVSMPEYLDRSEIVTYTSSYELKSSRDDLWAERLPANVTRVVADNLSILLGTNDVSVLPSKNIDRFDYEVSIEFEHFERTAVGDGILDAHWTILNGETQKVITRKRTKLNTRVPDDEYTSLAAVMSNNLALLSQEIAAAITERPKRNASSS